LEKKKLKEMKRVRGEMKRERGDRGIRSKLNAMEAKKLQWKKNRVVREREQRQPMRSGEERY